MIRVRHIAVAVLLASALAVEGAFGAAVETIWSWTYNGTGNFTDEIRADGVCVCPDGSVCFAGYTWGGGTSWDAVVGKLDASGDVIWVRTYDDSTIQNHAYAVTADLNGNVYAVGRSFNGDALFDLHVLKYDVSGTLVFSKEYSLSQNEDFAHSIAVDNGGSLYIGAFCSNGNGATAVLKCDSNGDTLWMRQVNAGGQNVNETVGIRIASDGSIFIGESTRIQTQFTSHDDFFVARLASDGTILWTRNHDEFGFSDFPWRDAFTVDSSQNSYMTGVSIGGGSGDDWLTVKYNSTGDLQWARRFNGPAGNLHDQAHDLTVDGSGNVYVGGFASRLDSSPEAVVIKYDSNGNALWERRPSISGQHLKRVRNVIADTNGKLYVACEGNDLVVFRFDSSGVQECATVVAGAGNQDDCGVDLLLDSQGRLVVAGITVGFGTGRDIILATFEWSCCQYHADPGANCIASDVIDVVKTVEVAFRGIAEVLDDACSVTRTDVDCTGFTNIVDVVTVVDVAFRGANPALRFCNPCNQP